MPDRDPKNEVFDQYCVEIYQLRQGLAPRGQPSRERDLQSLDKDSRRRNLSHPYVGTEPLQQALMRKPCFAEGAKGRAAAARTDGFLYRLCAPPKVVKYTDWLFWPRNYRHSGSDEKALFEWLHQHHQAVQDWIPLAKFARGILSAPRKFTWWTTEEMTPANLVDSAHRLGIPNEGIPTHALILRFPIGDLDLDRLRVPSVVDAFDSPIFHPTLDDEHPPAGRTIDLRNGKPGLGCEEYVLGPVPVEKISFLPVLVDEERRRKE